MKEKNDREKDRIAEDKGYINPLFWEADIVNNLDYVRQSMASYVASEPQRNWKR